MDLIFFWVAGCREHSCPQLFPNESFISVPLPSLLNTFLDTLLASSLTVSALSNVPSSLNRSWHVGPCNFSPQVSTRSLNTLNHQLTSCPLYLHSHSSCPHSHRVITRLLCLLRILQVGEYSLSPWVDTRLLNTYSPQVTTYPPYLHSHRVVTHLPWNGCTLPTSYLVLLRNFRCEAL